MLNAAPCRHSARLDCRVLRSPSRVRCAGLRPPLTAPTGRSSTHPTHSNFKRGQRISIYGRKFTDAGASKIKTFGLVVAIAVAVTIANKAVLAATIGFDDFNTGGGTAFAAANRYVSQGIVFSRTIPVEDVQAVEPAFFPTFLAQGGTPPNAMALTLVSPVGFLSINASFVVPGTATPATTDLVSVRVFDTNVGTTLGTLEAFNSSGVLIATDTATTPPSQAGTLEVAVPDIASAQFSSDSDGADFDNLVFRHAGRGRRARARLHLSPARTPARLPIFPHRTGSRSSMM